MNDFLNNCRNLLDNLLNVRNNLLNFLNFLINNDFLNDSFNFFDNNLFLFGHHDLFNYLGNLNNFLSNFFLNDQLFNNPVNWDWNLNWSDNRLLNLNHLNLLIKEGHDFFNFYIPWNFLHNLNQLFDHHFFGYNFFLESWDLDNFINYFLHNFFNFDKHILLFFDFKRSIDIHRHLNSPFNFSNNLFDNFFGHHFFDNLRNFNNFFHNSWYNNDFLDNFFYFHNFWNFDHLLNNFINLDSNFFDSVNLNRNFNNFFNIVLVRLWDFDIMSDLFFNLNDFRFMDNQGVSYLDFFDHSLFNFLNNRYFYIFFLYSQNFLNDGNLNNSLYFPRNFSH